MFKLHTCSGKNIFICWKMESSIQRGVRRVEWNFPSFNEWKYSYHCTHNTFIICIILHWQENPMCTYNIFYLQFHNCYLLFEYKPLLKQCRILCHLRLWKLFKSVILNFWIIAGFWRKLYVPRTTILYKPRKY